MNQIITDEVYNWADNIDNDCNYIDQIHELYYCLLEQVNNVNKQTFDPNIFTYLTVDQFTDWVISMHNKYQ